MSDPFILIISPHARLPLTISRYHDWQTLAEQGGYLLWNRDGHVRRVPNARLRNVLDTYINYVHLCEAEKVNYVPESMCGIDWTDTDPAHQTPSG